MNKSSYCVNGANFPTKTALHEAIKDILHSYYPGDNLDAGDSDFMFDVLSMHPEAAAKIGVGVQSFTLAVDPKHRTKHFVLVRTDGTRTDFSYMKCLTAPTPYGLLLAAMRDAIAPGVIRFRDMFFATTANPLCPISGVPMTSQSAHVDHVPPNTFRYLADGFMRVKVFKGGVMGDVSGMVKPNEDGDIGRQFADERLKARWIEFHWEYAELRVLDARAHLSQKHGEDLYYYRELTPEECQNRTDDISRMIAMGYTLTVTP